MTVPARTPRSEEELPELPALEGDDEPLGDAAGAVTLSDDAASLDDSLSEVPLDHDFADEGTALESDDHDLDLGDAHEGLDLSEGTGATDDRSFEDQDPATIAEPPSLADDGDRGEEGPAGELLALESPPPMDDDDDDDAPREAPARARVITLGVDEVTDLAVDGVRAWVLSGDLRALDLAHPTRAPVERLELPDALCAAVAVDRRGVPVLATLDGELFTPNPDGGWSPATPASPGALALLHEGGRVTARCRSGALVAVDDPTTQIPLRRVTAWAADRAGVLLAADGASRGALQRREEGGAWRALALPPGVVASRLAVRGAAVAVLDASQTRVWLCVDEGAPWTHVDVPAGLDVGLARSDDGRVTLLVASAVDAESVALLRGDIDALSLELQRVLVLRRASADDDGQVRLVAVGSAGVLCAMVVDGRAYVIAAG